jgi:chitodextrinase
MWSASKDDVAIAGYELLRGGSIVATTTRTFARDDGLSPATEYCYAVRAFDSAGNRS